MYICIFSSRYLSTFVRMVQHMSREVVERPVCTCGSHMVWNRVRLSMLNEEERTRILLSALKKVQICEWSTVNFIVEKASYLQHMQ